MITIEAKLTAKIAKFKKILCVLRGLSDSKGLSDINVRSHVVDAFPVDNPLQIR
jgi:hypothetical protein